MNPRLVSISGPLKGTSLELTEAEITIGRDAANQINLVDVSVSRHHCVIRKESSSFQIQDRESLNGTFVNGVPVKDRMLEHGDQIEIGDSIFVFLEDSVEMPTAAPMEWTEIGEAPSSTMELRREDSAYHRLEKWKSSESSAARNLAILLKVSQSLNTLRNRQELQEKLFALISEAIPAHRGVLIIADEDLENVSSVYSWSREGKQTVPVSRTVARRVFEQRVGILSNDVPEESLGKAHSLAANRVHSLLCVPLEAYDRFLGLVYLDTADPSTRFEADHLEILTGIAAITSVALENLRHLSWLESENRRLNSESRIEHEMVGESVSIQEVYSFIEKVASTDSTVLICGESGTGKELIARAIHRNSPRASKPFVAVNCATLTETLLESELFGHEKGAFTGAITQKKGKFEIADQGTLFLDEVAEMASPMQAKLLRTLQQREIERIGGIRPIRIDVRVIAATNKDLKQSLQSGTFRADLFYRLNVVALTVPPLRERREDIPLLANYFCSKYSGKFHRKVLGFSSEARAFLMRYDWPGNVRELENAVERAVVLGSTEWILAEDLPDSILDTETDTFAPGKYHEGLRETKKQLILKAVEQAHGNYTEAAKILGVHPNYLHRLIRNLNLKSLLKY